MTNTTSADRGATSRNLAVADRLYRTSGVGKFLSDTASVFEINFIPFLKQWYISVLLASGTALPWFYAVSYTHLTLPTKRIV